MSSGPKLVGADGGIIIGVGHAERQDDGVGPYVARALARQRLPAVAHEGDGSGLLELWQDRPVCVMVDAIGLADQSPSNVGQIQVFFEPDDAAFARAAFVHSSHRVGLPEAVALGKALDRLPDRLIVIGIVGAVFGFGCALSPLVASSAERLIACLASAEEPFGQGAMAALARL